MDLYTKNGRVIRLVEGDITRIEADAIVNAANARLAGGGGVDGAIHRAGGPSIMAECDAIRRRTGGIKTGEAVATTAGMLKARFVIHTAGPIWSGGGKGEDDLLRSCYRNSIRIAADEGCRSIAFPSISTGVYRFPVQRAASIALDAVYGELMKHEVEEAVFVLFSRSDHETYSKALDELSARLVS